MDLKTFRQIVDSARLGNCDCTGDLQQLNEIHRCFTSGHSALRHTCKSICTDLIREHVLLGVSLDPYLNVLNHLLDAVNADDGNPRAPIEGDWNQAIRIALDCVRIDSRDPKRRHNHDFQVAKAARALRDEGFAIRLEPGRLSIEEKAETALVATIEDTVATMGGINVARRIFNAISPLYDPEQQRYHLAKRPPMDGGGHPQMPWGYLVQLAAKHAQGRKPYKNNDNQWRRLCRLAQDYAAVIDVQPYTPSFFGAMNATDLVPHLQKMAVYDMLFRIPQMRSADVVKIAHGMLSWLDPSVPMKAGWSIDQVLCVIDYLLSTGRNMRGPIFVAESDIRRALSHIPREIMTRILGEVLSHPLSGANQHFSRPTDTEHDFFRRPLLRMSDRQFVMLDRSVCAHAFLEALLTQLREEIERLDDKIGPAIERFIEAEFASHGVPVRSGSYVVADNDRGECDLVIETPETVIFLEVKKKSLTRLARSGSDTHLLLDLANSLLLAQAQAGWHEVRLRHYGYLDLKREDEATTRLELNGRQVGRVAVTLFDFGSFQDRILLSQFLEAAMRVQFIPTPTAQEELKEKFAKIKEKFAKINAALDEIRDQVMELHPGQNEIDQPFFDCWFLSIPQLLVFLDWVTDVDSFKALYRICRGVTTGSSDFYSDLLHSKKLLEALYEDGRKAVKPTV